MVNFGKDLDSQTNQIEDILRLLSLSELQSKGIQLGESEYSPDTDEDYLAQIKLPTQFNFEEQAIGLGLTLPLSGNLTFNWYTENELLGSYTSTSYDRFCIPMSKKYRNQRFDWNFDWNTIGQVPKDFALSVREWLTDTTFLAHDSGGQFSFEMGLTLSPSFFSPGSYELAVDGSHRVIAKYGLLYNPNATEDVVLFRQYGFLSVESSDDFYNLENKDYNWYSKYKSGIVYSELLSTGVFHFDIENFNINLSATLYDGSTLGSTSVKEYLSIRLTSSSADNGKVVWANDEWGNNDPRIAIDLRDDASFEVRIKDEYETTTSGMPRIIFWGADPSALPADASAIPANGWCIQWDTSYTQLEVFKDGVSQGTGAIPAQVLGDIDFWINVIAVGASDYQIFFNDVLAITVARTYTFTHSAVGVFAYNWDGGAGTSVTCRFLSATMATIGRLAGEIRKIRYSSSSQTLWWVDKHGCIVRYNIAANTYITASFTGFDADSWWEISDDTLWTLRESDTYLQGLNLTTLVPMYNDDRSGEVDFLGYSCHVDSDNNLLIIYEKDNFLVEYETLTDSPYIRTTVAANYPQLKELIVGMEKENPFKHDSNGWIRGQRYWHSRLLLTDLKYQSREIIWSPNKKNLVVLGGYESPLRPDNVEYCWVIAQEPEGFTQTGRVWSMSPLPAKSGSAIQLIASGELNLNDGSILLIGSTDEELDALNFMSTDTESVYRMIFSGAASSNGTHSVNLLGKQRINVRAANNVITRQADTPLTHLINVGALGILHLDVWSFGGVHWGTEIATNNAGATTFNSITFVGWGISRIRTLAGNFKVGSSFEVWKYPKKGFGDDNYYMG